MLELKQLRDLDDLLDQIYEESTNNERFKELLKFTVSKNDKNKDNFSSTQIRNLETLAYSSNNLSDIKNYIKNQVGKDTKKSWAGRIIDNKCFGQVLLEEIIQIEQKAAKKYDITEFKLKAVRGFIHQFVSEYLYKSKSEAK